MAIERKRIKNRRDTATNWATNNPILLAGEFGVELDTNRVKVGDGINYYNDLEYVSLSESEITALITDTSYTKSEIDGEISAIEASIGAKADADSTYTKTEVDSALNGLNTAINTKADAATTYTKTEVDEIKAEIEAEIPTVPTNVSAFTNDAGYLTEHQSLDGYATEDWVEAKGYLTEHQELKTINGNSLVGTGDITISGGASDWSEIQNKPDFADVATSGSYNDLTDTPTIPTVPTNVSAFTNDAGYLTEHQSLEGYATEQWVEGKGYITTYTETDPVFTNSPAYNITSQNITDWNNKSDFSGSYNDLTNKPTIPTATSDLTNDSNYVASTDLATVATSGSYNDLTDKPTIPTVPTNVSAFTNDAGYLTEHQSLEGYATETWVEGKGYSTFSGSYNDLTDTPTIPTVNNNTITLTQGGVTKGTFTLNQNADATIDFDEGGSTDNNWFGTQAEYDALGTYDENTIYHIESTLATVATTGSYNDLTDKPTIPTDETDLGLSTETWTFTLADNTTVTKRVVIK